MFGFGKSKVEKAVRLQSAAQDVFRGESPAKAAKKYGLRQDEVEDAAKEYGSREYEFKGLAGDKQIGLFVKRNPWVRRSH